MKSKHSLKDMVNMDLIGHMEKNEIIAKYLRDFSKKEINQAINSSPLTTLKNLHAYSMLLGLMVLVNPILFINKVGSDLLIFAVFTAIICSAPYFLTTVALRRAKSIQFQKLTIVGITAYHIIFVTVNLILGILNKTLGIGFLFIIFTYIYIQALMKWKEYEEFLQKLKEIKKTK